VVSAGFELDDTADSADTTDSAESTVDAESTDHDFHPDSRHKPWRRNALPGTTTTALKIAIVGPVGVGKTTLVSSVSEISPLTTEEAMSREGAADGPPGLSTKTATTVAMDFGRISLSDRVVLYLFGTPGQERFWFLWDGLVDGALGAVLLVDVRRLEESFDVLERLENRGVAFIVAANGFPGAPIYSIDTLREALDLPESVPIIHCDARERASCRDVLLTLTHYLLRLTPEPAPEPAPAIPHG